MTTTLIIALSYQEERGALVANTSNIYHRLFDEGKPVLLLTDIGDHAYARNDLILGVVNDKYASDVTDFLSTVMRRGQYIQVRTSADLERFLPLRLGPIHISARMHDQQLILPDGRFMALLDAGPGLRPIPLSHF